MALPKVLANFETSLASKLSSAATTGTLNTSTDPEGTTLSGQYILTLDEGTSSEEHVLATLSGASITAMTRGLNRADGTTSVAGNKKEHSRGASVKITNMNLLLINDLINGNTQFDADNIMAYDAEPSFTTASNQIATVKFAEDQANAGAADMSTVQKGIAEEATQAEIDADTAAGGTGARLAINPSTLATSKYGTQLPSSDEKGALAGTSGTPSASNKYVTADDVSDAGAASKVVRADASSQVTVAATPTASTHAASKGWVESQTPSTDKLVGPGGATDAKTYFNFEIPWVISSNVPSGDFWTLVSTTATSTLSALHVTSSDVTNTVISSTGVFLQTAPGSGSSAPIEFDDGKDVFVEFGVKMNSTGTENHGWGLAESTAPFLSEIDSTVDAACFCVTSAGVLVAHTSDKGVGYNNTTITGVTLTDYNVFRIEFDGGNTVKFYVNGALEATHTEGVEEIPDGANDIKFGIGATGSSDGSRVITAPQFSVEI